MVARRVGWKIPYGGESTTAPGETWNRRNAGLLSVSAKLRAFIGIFATNADAVCRAFGQQNFGQ